MSYLLQEQQNLIVSTADSMTVAHNVFWISLNSWQVWFSKCLFTGRLYYVSVKQLLIYCYELLSLIKIYGWCRGLD